MSERARVRDMGGVGGGGARKRRYLICFVEGTGGGAGRGRDGRARALAGGASLYAPRLRLHPHPTPPQHTNECTHVLAGRGVVCALWCRPARVVLLVLLTRALSMTRIGVLREVLDLLLASDARSPLS